MVRFNTLIFGDPHINPYSEFASPTEDGSTTLLEELGKSFVWLSKSILDSEIQHVIMLGDMFHKNNSIDVLTIQFIMKFIIPMIRDNPETGFYLVRGNHDTYSNKPLIHLLRLFEQYSNVQVISTPDVIDIGGSVVGCIPYTEVEAEVKSAISSFRKRKVQTVFSHLDITGAVWYKTGKPSDSGFNPDMFNNFSVFNGHHHHPEQIGSVVNVGSLIYRSFQDNPTTDPRGAIMAKMEEGGRISDYCRIENPFSSIYQTIEVSSYEELALHTSRIVNPKRAYVRIKKLAEFEIPESASNVLKAAFKDVKVTTSIKKTLEKRSQVSNELGPERVVEIFVTEKMAGNPTATLDAARLINEGKTYVNKALGEREIALRSGKIFFASLKIENFLSIEQAEFRYGTSGLVLVIGVNEHSISGDNNGAGKTAMFLESLIWCLTGKTIKPFRFVDSVIRRGTKEGVAVTVVFIKGESVIEITRARKHPKYGTGLSLVINGESIDVRVTEDVENYFGRILGFGFEELRHLLCVNLDPRYCFSRISGDKDKKKLIESFCGMEMYEEAGKRASEECNKIQKGISGIKLKLSNIDGRLQEVNSMYTMLLHRKESIQRNAAAEISRIERDIDLKSESINKGILHRDEMVITISSLRSTLETLGKKHADVFNAINKIAVETAVVKSRVQDISNRVDGIKRLIAAGKCPVCNSPTAGNISLSEELSSLAKEREDLLSTQETMMEKEMLLSYKLGGIKDRFDFRSSELSGLDNEFSAVCRQISADNEMLEYLSEEKSRILKDINQHDDILVKCKGDCDKLFAEKHEAEGMLGELDEDLEYASFWVNGFSLTELRSMVMDNVIDFINERMIEYSDIMFSGEKLVQMSNQRERGTRSNKLDILVNGDPEIFAGSSSGELVREDLIIQFALRDLSSKYLNWFNLLVVDEVDKSLDRVGVERLIDMLQRIAAEKFVMLISHDPVLQSQINNVWCVFKDKNEVSRLKLSA